MTVCSTASRSTQSSSATATQRVLPSDSRFRYQGRIDFAVPDHPVIIWQASTISLDFEGDSLTILFDQVTGQACFDVHIDSTTRILDLREGQPIPPAHFSGCGTGRHHLRLFKRSEANAGAARFGGVELPHSAQAWQPEPPTYALAMEFIGDSITVGACNEDGETDQWDDRKTHNNALSYAALTAAAFHADYRNIAISGMGIITGYVEVKAGQVWDRLYATPSSPRADFSQWRPQVVFVNLGENDNSYTSVNNQPFPPDYTDGYVTLVRSIRGTYPSAHVVLLRGGMSGGALSDPLRHAWESAVTQLEAVDRAISHYVFSHWSGPHPRVVDDRAMADELIRWLKTQPFMAPR